MCMYVCIYIYFLVCAYIYIYTHVMHLMGFKNQLVTGGQHIVSDPREWKSHGASTYRYPKKQYLIRKVVS